MRRACAHCTLPLTAGDLDREVTADMEADRLAAGLRGVRFLYYACGGCGAAAIFVHLLPLKGERPDRLARRRADLEAAVRRLRAERAEEPVAAVVLG